MTTPAGRLEVEIVTGLARLHSEMTQVRGIIGSTMSAVERSVMSAARAIAGLASVGAFANMIREGAQAEQSINRLNAVLNATGNATGFASAQLHKLADQMARTTQFTDESFRDSIATLAKFGDITNTVMTRALKVSADFAAFTGGDLKSATEALGKAISSPEQGMERLQRSMGYFDKAQIEMIKNMQDSGDKIGAQTKLLDILEGKIGGVAEAMNTGLTKALGDVKKEWSELNEAIAGSWLVQNVFIGAMGGAANAMREFRAVFDGDWTEKAIRLFGMFNAGGRMFGPTFKPEALGGGDPAAARAVRERAELEAHARFLEAMGKQDERAIQVALANQAKLTESQRQQWAELSREWVKYIEDQIENDKRLADAIHKNAADRTAAERAAIALSSAEWVKKIELDIAAYEDGLRVMAGMQPSMMQLFDESKRRAVEMWTQVGEAAGDFFADLILDGRNAFDNLKRWLKQLLAEMIKIFATRWILQLGAAAVGGGAGSALAGQAASYGANTLGGMAITAGSAYLFGTGATAYGAGAAGAFAGSVATGTVASAGVIGSGGAMASVYSALSAIPVWGWIAMAVIAAVAFFSGRGGGPKVEGSSVGSFDAAGNPLGAYRVSDEYGNRFLRGTQMDSALDPLRDSTGATYRSLVGRLGGTFGTAGFGFGASNDPEGNARSRVFGNAMVNGRNVFDGIMDVDDKEVDAALMLTSKRAILAALQATDFADEIDAIFAGAGDVARLTGEQIDAVIASAREMYSVIEGLNKLGEGRFGLEMTVETLRLFALEGETIGQTFQRVGGAWLQLQEAFTSDTAKLAAAQKALDDSGISLPATRDAWLDMMRALDLSTESGREMFTTMMNLAPAFDAVTSAAESMRGEWEDLQDILARYNGGTDLSIAVGRFQAGNAWSQGMSPEQLIAAFRTITAEDFASYSSANRALINSILGLGLNIQGLDRTIQVSGPSASGRSQQEIDFENYYRGQGARQGLRDWRENFMLGDLSTLPPDQMMEMARQTFMRTLGLAQGGDVDAISRLGGDAESYLRFSRQRWGSSSAYVADFEAVMRGVNSVASPAETTEKFQTDSIGYQASMATDLTSVRRLLERIADREDATTEPSADRARR